MNSKSAKRCSLAFLALFVAIVPSVSSWYATSSQAVTGVYRNGNFSNTPEWATIHVLQNEFDEPIAVLIHHGKSKRQGPHFSPVAFRSDLTWKHHYPPSIDESGVWVDGRKQRLGDELAVLYVTDTNNARYIEIRDEDKIDFLAHARAGGDPLKFVNQWIRFR